MDSQLAVTLRLGNIRNASGVQRKGLCFPVLALIRPWQMTPNMCVSRQRSQRLTAFQRHQFRTARPDIHVMHVISEDGDAFSTAAILQKEGVVLCEFPLEKLPDEWN